ncbi:hypothetical protein LSAT2_000939 [Lamellibrachia satsuma]|nr:hypothetical protein LSAT2_000939 [Lamellibrachia satsuma]
MALVYQTEDDRHKKSGYQETPRKARRKLTQITWYVVWEHLVQLDSLESDHLLDSLESDHLVCRLGTPLQLDSQVRSPVVVWEHLVQLDSLESDHLVCRLLEHLVQLDSLESDHLLDSLESDHLVCRLGTPRTAGQSRVRSPDIRKITTKHSFIFYDSEVEIIQQKMEEIDTKKTEKKVSVFGEQKAWASLAFVLKSPMCKQNGIVKSWTKQAAPAVMETAKKKQVPDSRKQSFDQPFSPKTPWRGPVLRKSNHVKLFPTKSRINEMAARERQLESERLEAMEAVRSELSNGTKNTRKKKKLVEVEQPQKEKEIRKPPLPPLKFIKSPPRDPNIPSAANEFTRMTMDAFRYFPTGNPKFYHDFFDQTMSYDARIMANENVFCHSPRIATSGI